MSKGQTDIVIIGGGLAGLSLAAVLGQSGLSVVLAEPYPPKAFKDTETTGRTVALMNSSVNVIKAAGIWERIEDLTNPLQVMRIIDDSSKLREPVEIEFPASEIGFDQFGFNIPNAPLRAALFERVQKFKSVKIIKAGFESFTEVPGGIVVHFSDGSSVKASLLVGADGRNSPVREAAGISAKAKKYDQSAITCVINHSRSHCNISTEFHRPAGPFALVPLPGNRSSVVWVERTERANEIVKLKKSEFLGALQEATNNILGGITLETGPECWPLFTIKAGALSAPRIALIAEAAHVMSPITAQGLNLSLRDVAALAESIVDAARLGLDAGSQTVLKGYEKRRRIDVDTRIFGVDRMNTIVSTDFEGLKGLRRIGLRGLENIQPLRLMAMNIGLAPRLDEGRLLRGEAL